MTGGQNGSRHQQARRRSKGGFVPPFIVQIGPHTVSRLMFDLFNVQIV
jgi:hypothetical protein